MRKISFKQILIFLFFCAIIMFCAFLTSTTIANFFPVGAYGPILTVGLFLLLTSVYAICVYRINLSIFPLPIGEITPQSKDEFSYHIHLLFFLIFFHPIMRSEILPMPFMKLFYLGLGAKMGNNSFSGGIIFDPIFVEIGSNTIVGQGAMIIPHVIENERLAHYPIKIGNNVTIGTGARILPGATIEDGALISANAVVLKGAHIAREEIWGGVPAKKIGHTKKKKTTSLGEEVSA